MMLSTYEGMFLMDTGPADGDVSQAVSDLHSRLE